jgi:hypothetical protein
LKNGRLTDRQTKIQIDENKRKTKRQTEKDSRMRKRSNNKIGEIKTRHPKTIEKGRQKQNYR